MKNRHMQALLAGPDGLGTALRTARGPRSMQQLADALAAITSPDAKVSKWNSSKVSKLETGQQLPSEAEVDLWADVTEVNDATRARWHEMHADAESKRSVYRRRAPAVRGAANASAGLEAVTAYTRIVELALIPELLQIEGYTRAVLGPAYADGELASIVGSLRKRQEALHASEKKFQFLVGEAALRTVRGDKEVMAAQLDKVISAATLPSVTIGIIPLSAVLHGPPIVAGFALYDLDEAVVNDGVEEHRYTGAPAAMLRERLDAAWEDAVEGRAARKLVMEIADSLDGS